MDAPRLEGRESPTAAAVYLSRRHGERQHNGAPRRHDVEARCTTQKARTAGLVGEREKNFQSLHCGAADRLGGGGGLWNVAGTALW